MVPAYADSLPPLLRYAQRMFIPHPFFFREAAENHFPDVRQARQRFLHGTERTRGGQIGRVAVDPGADAGKGNGFQPRLGGEFQRIAVAGGKQRRFAVFAAAPDGANSVDDVSGGKAEAGGNFGLARGAAVQGAAAGQQFRPGGAVNGSIDPAATQEGIVGGVDDSVDSQCRNIGTNGA